MAIRIALIGTGAVGRGILEAMTRKDLGIVLTGVADSRSGMIHPDGISSSDLLTRKRETGLCGDVSITADDVVLTAPYDVLVEVSPTDAATGEPATSYIRTALSRGCHVVTSNKGPVALHYHELKQEADKAGVSFRFEATVAGAIPILHTLLESLGGNEVQALYGVLNGTCNYILTRMAEEGLSYKQALDEARALGYAEADPTYDVKGIDAAIKLVILANTVLNQRITLEDIDITGIDLLTEEAIRLAEEQDATIRLIGEIIPGKNLYRLSPRIIPRHHPLVVHGSLNAIILRTDLAGDLVFSGKGAGSLETASAVLGDILSIRDRYAGGN
ncbi:homoserine dehydrogenase [Methanospirillum hungatei]|jgi:homoserine dehydrogenase|uniref:homoserine dehydrogenase n=1 Tax=Methanospirillum hungatei TaxID=2203 RepID=UPI0009CFBA3F|nr:homoserine dehydrogenase [Methanospirillum hungatei]MBP9009336.1 homoserine dehydrogenase [Methanospirillum sp.]OQA55136.1 MAG: homoserine dehydrogenase [Euryarchaeota archaeon ADurb.Bin294]HOW04470.1 homoserine dehydrogenase [Methanospirillum hungatei]